MSDGRGTGERVLLNVLEVVAVSIEEKDPKYFLRSGSMSENALGAPASVWGNDASARSGDGWIRKVAYDFVLQGRTDEESIKGAKRYANELVESVNEWCKLALQKSLIQVSDQGGQRLLVDALRCIIETRRAKLCNK